MVGAIRVTTPHSRLPRSIIAYHQYGTTIFRLGARQHIDQTLDRYRGTYSAGRLILTDIPLRFPLPQALKLHAFRKVRLLTPRLGRMRVAHPSKPVSALALTT